VLVDEHLRIRPMGPDDLVFCAPEGGPVRLASWRRRVSEPAIAAPGLAPFRPQDLRHTAVALWIAAVASPKEVATRARHTSVVTVLDRYGHLLPGAEKHLNDALDALANDGHAGGTESAPVPGPLAPGRPDLANGQPAGDRRRRTIPCGPDPQRTRRR
jgi:hypothetical protein